MRTGDSKSKSYLLQRISMAVDTCFFLQRGDAASILSYLPAAEGFEAVFSLYFINCLVLLSYKTFPLKVLTPQPALTLTYPTRRTTKPPSLLYLLSVYLPEGRRHAALNTTVVMNSTSTVTTVRDVTNATFTWTMRRIY